MVDGLEQSPIVKRLAWGEMVIDNLGSGRDFKLYPGGGRAWDWTETNTHHQPGIQVTDIEELLDHGSQVVVLSRGIQSKLHTCSDVFRYLHAKNICVCAAETNVAVEIYNSLAASGVRVGGLFHSTC
ncbi:MAG TPA: MTH938/NDUFAF3 family protein [Pseudomonadales bacterium]|nr:MTH938/NDUFAF3 family protein [Pseudomonadales bacterium]